MAAVQEEEPGVEEAVSVVVVVEVVEMHLIVPLHLAMVVDVKAKSCILSPVFIFLDIQLVKPFSLHSTKLKFLTTFIS